jgi:hypothetical protein
MYLVFYFSDLKYILRKNTAAGNQSFGMKHFRFRRPSKKNAISLKLKRRKNKGTFLKQPECGYGFPALIHVWIASAGGVRMVYTHNWRSHECL